MLMQDELRAVREFVLRKAGCGVFIKLYKLFDVAKQPLEALGRKVVFRIEFGPHDCCLPILASAAGLPAFSAMDALGLRRPFVPTAGRILPNGFFTNSRLFDPKPRFASASQNAA